MNPTPPTRCLFSVEAESDPTVAGRILHVLTVRGEIPEWFSVRKAGADALRIAIEVAGVDESAAHYVAQKIRNLPTVLDVTTAWLHRRDALMP